MRRASLLEEARIQKYFWVPKQYLITEHELGLGPGALPAAKENASITFFRCICAPECQRSSNRFSLAGCANRLLRLPYRDMQKKYSIASAREYINLITPADFVKF